MKKIFTFLVLLSSFISTPNNKKIIVALSLNDCISCTASLYQINSSLNNPEMLFYF